MNSRKIAGLILSSIGALIYILYGIIFVGFISPTEFMFLALTIEGYISLMGTLIGVIKIKMGGVVILISIPLTIFFALVLNNIFVYSPYFLYFPSQDTVFFILSPSLHSAFVIIGGILCLTSSDD